MIAIPALQR